MLKKLTVILVLLVFIISAVPVSAAQDQVIYKSTIKVTEDGGTYRVGFVDVKFKKDFLGRDMQPIRIYIEISAVDGIAGIEFAPDIPSFNKDVTIRVDSYDGLLYDKTKKRNILVHIRKQQFTVKHFSRYAFL